MPREGHTNVHLPDSLAERLDRIVEEGKWGYQGRAEILRDAVRRFLEERLEIEQREDELGQND